MKRILSIGCVLVSVLALAGCEDIPGVLIVTKNFNVLVKGKSKTLTTGEHKTSLDFKKNRVVAKIETVDGSLKVELAVPEDSQIPSNGNFELRSSQTGQPFDTFGAVQTQVTDSQRQTGFESCQKEEYQTICDPNGCHVVPILRPGTRSIEFFYRDTHQAMQFDMTAIAEAKNKYAHFDGSAHYSEKIITYQGPCF